MQSINVPQLHLFSNFCTRFLVGYLMHRCNLRPPVRTPLWIVGPCPRAHRMAGPHPDRGACAAGAAQQRQRGFGVLTARLGSFFQLSTDTVMRVWALVKIRSFFTPDLFSPILGWWKGVQNSLNYISHQKKPMWDTQRLTARG